MYNFWDYADVARTLLSGISDEVLAFNEGKFPNSHDMIGQNSQTF